MMMRSNTQVWCGHLAKTLENEKLNLIMFLFGDMYVYIWHIVYIVSHQNDLFVAGLWLKIMILMPQIKRVFIL